jgi:hypothetical protein
MPTMSMWISSEGKEPSTLLLRNENETNCPDQDNLCKEKSSYWTMGSGSQLMGTLTRRSTPRKPDPPYFSRNPLRSL